MWMRTMVDEGMEAVGTRVGAFTRDADFLIW